MLPTRPRSLLSAALRRKPYICQSCRRSLHQSLRPRPIALNPTARHLHAAARLHDDVVPFRKQLKDEERRQKAEHARPKGPPSSVDRRRLEKKYELTVGIEIHAELNTARKLFSTAATSTADNPNTHAAFFDVALPGAQPAFQPETLLPALRAAIALGCTIEPRSSFDRKHYFYQDQPQGYQITQYYEPFARNGSLTLDEADGIDPRDRPSIDIGIKQIQMEQDTAKTIAQPPATHLLDFNRVSHPLIEIITHPDMHYPATAAAFVRKVQQILRSVGAVTAGMEVGGLRADVNVSVARRAVSSPGMPVRIFRPLGQRTEIKNLSSVRGVDDAICAERDRQMAVLEAGGVVEAETRGWTLGSTETRRLRGKEGEVDYRYMPDPDLAPVLIGEDLVQHLRDTLPALPSDTRQKLVEVYGLSVKDAMSLLELDDGDRLDYYFEVVRILKELTTAEEQASLKLAKAAGNWVLMEIGGLLSIAEVPFSDALVPPEKLASLVLHLQRRQITGPTAKRLLHRIFYGDDDRPVERIIEEDNLRLRPMSKYEYEVLAMAVLDDNPHAVAAIKNKGQEGKIMFLLGQMVRRGEEGRVEAQKAEETLRELLA